MATSEQFRNHGVKEHLRLQGTSHSPSKTLIISREVGFQGKAMDPFKAEGPARKSLYDWAKLTSGVSRFSLSLPFLGGAEKEPVWRQRWQLQRTHNVFCMWYVHLAIELAIWEPGSHLRNGCQEQELFSTLRLDSWDDKVTKHGALSGQGSLPCEKLRMGSWIPRWEILNLCRQSQHRGGLSRSTIRNDSSM